MRKSPLAILAVALAMTVVACSGQPRKSAAGQVPGGESVSPTAQGTSSASATPSVGPSGTVGQSSGGGGGGAGGGGGSGGGGGGGGGGGTGTWRDAALFAGAANTRGITKDSLTLCEHAGITLASAFGNDPKQFVAYWQMVNDEMGGVYGRKVNLVITDDGYNANQAATAFDDCVSNSPFMIIGGIGFDQIPTVRTKAEQSKELYVYGTATENGTAGNQYSFSVAPSVENFGRRFAEALLKNNKVTKVGILTVSSDGWKGGADIFESLMKSAHKEVTRREISSNNDVLTSHVVAFEQAGVQAVFLNVNALAFTRFVTEADSQSYYPILTGWAFNLSTDTVGSTMKKWPSRTIQGLSATSVYDPATNYPWSSEMARMRSYYAKYYGNNNPNDIDWIQWTAMKGFHRLLLDCGKDCTRNRFAGMLLAGYRPQDKPGYPIKFSPGESCAVDFARGGGRFGGWYFNYWDVVARGSTAVWSQRETCVDHF